jgi:hypothetical protein
VCKKCNDEKEIKEKEKKVRKVFLDELPRKYGFGVNKDKLLIDWGNSIGYKIRFIYDNIKSKVEIVGYNNKTRKLHIKYNNKFLDIYTGNFQKCQFGKLLNTYTGEFKIELGQTFKDNRRDLVVINREYRLRKSKNDEINEKWYKYKCNKCNCEDWIVEDSLLFKEIGCSICSGKKIIKGINDVATTNPELAKLFWNKEDTYKYTEHSGKKTDFKCPDCGEKIRNKSVDKINNNGLSCPRCSDGVSYPEKFMHQVLKELNIQFTYQYRPKWCTYELNNKKKFGIYDFYFELDGQKYIIEMDGGLGHGKKDNKMNGQTKEESKQIDDIKDKLANKHNIEVIRIDCNYNHNRFEYIKNKIINSKLNDIFNLNMIDWLKCNEYACNSLIKKACELWNNNINNTKEIGKILKLTQTTIIRYLKQGNLIGWCNYDPKKEFIKSSRKRNKNGKLVEIFKNGISLGQFESCAELERQSEELFGVKLYNQNVSKVCNNKIKFCKNFTFKYIEERSDYLDSK